VADSRITQRPPPYSSTGGRDRPESVVAINRNRWSQSIGNTGRDRSVRASLPPSRSLHGEAK
jgi:hypothetical protein